MSVDVAADGDCGAEHGKGGRPRDEDESAGHRAYEFTTKHLPSRDGVEVIDVPADRNSRVTTAAGEIGGWQRWLRGSTVGRL
jgi:hypothetical protein